MPNSRLTSANAASSVVARTLTRSLSFVIDCENFDVPYRNKDPRQGRSTEPARHQCKHRSNSCRIALSTRIACTRQDQHVRSPRDGRIVQ
ncbi:hypothetical protein KM043_012792 [Ampulex compressa]|nr:hypothetical protein KM043_012792 [Ampulex compressa]